VGSRKSAGASFSSLVVEAPEHHSIQHFQDFLSPQLLNRQALKWQPESRAWPEQRGTVK
jgi:hypothetical protein